MVDPDFGWLNLIIVFLRRYDLMEQATLMTASTPKYAAQSVGEKQRELAHKM